MNDERVIAAGHPGAQEGTVCVSRPFWPFVLYLLFFFGTWTAWVYAVYPHLQRLGEATFSYAAISLLSRFAIWVAPVFLYLRYVDRVRPPAYLRMDTRWAIGVRTGLLASTVLMVGSLVRYGAPNWGHLCVTWNSILGSSILVGFVEEIPFRGFMLRKLQEHFSLWGAALYSSVLFVAIHIPGYVLLGMLSWYRLGFLLVFGLVMAGLVAYSRSLWSSIIAHSVNDFLSQVIFHV